MEPTTYDHLYELINLIDTLGLALLPWCLVALVGTLCYLALKRI